MKISVQYVLLGLLVSSMLNMQASDDSTSSDASSSGEEAESPVQGGSSCWPSRKRQKISRKSAKTEQPDSVLGAAIRAYDAAHVEWLLQENNKLASTSVNNKGRLPISLVLHLGVRCGITPENKAQLARMLKALLAHGANPNVNVSGCLAINYLADKANLGCPAFYLAEILATSPAYDPALRTGRLKRTAFEYLNMMSLPLIPVCTDDLEQIMGLLTRIEKDRVKSAAELAQERKNKAKEEAGHQRQQEAMMEAFRTMQAQAAAREAKKADV